MLTPSAGQLISERYELEREMAQGGMGAVWVARDRKLRRGVAVKLMDPRLVESKSAARRFRREAMAVARLHSPHIVEVHDFGLEEDCAYIVMELLEGEDLSRRLKRKRQLPLDEVVRIVIQTAKGLTVAHRAHIVHRDLKPGNVFLVRTLDEDLVKVVDFGVAKALHDASDSLTDATREGALVGTPRYMSPEQAHGAKEVDHRSDLWSLAVIAYAAITGQHPFPGSGMGEILAKIIADPPLRVRGVDASLASALDDFFERALAKQPEERFQTARELAHALARVAELDASEISLVLHERAESADEGTLGSATRVESSAVADDTTEGLAQPTVHDAVRPRRWKLPLMLGAAAALALSLSLSLSREDAARATSRLAQVPAARSMPVEPAPLSLEPAPHVEPAPTVAPKADKPPPMRKRPTRAPEAPPPAQPPSSEPPPPSRDLFSTPKG